MERHAIELTGRVRRTDTREGVHGLRAELVVDCDGERSALGSALSDREGRFHICGPWPRDPCCALHLVLYDCEGRPIHDTAKEGCGLTPMPDRELDVDLPPATLWWHLRCCESFECPSDPLLAREVLDDITEAFDVLGIARLKRGGEILECLQRSVPLIGRFDRLLADACATLEGDLEAGERVRDAMQLLCSDRGDRCCCADGSAHEAFLAGVFESEVSPASPATEDDDCAEQQAPVDPCAPCPTPDPTCPCRDHLIAEDKVQALVMAILQISCGHRDTARTYLAALLEQLCRFELIGALHRAAVPATCGDEAAAQQFRDVLEVVSQRCGAGLCCCEACIDEARAGCIRDAVAAWKHVSCWTVTSIDPVRACPGDRVVICGRGFGRQPGTVSFRTKGSLDYGLEAQPELWTESRIEVVVPERAGCGLVPRPRPTTLGVCGRHVDVRPLGCMEAEFEGTSPEILKFVVKDLADGACLRPGTPIRLRWKTCAVDRVRVEIRNRKTGSVIAAQDPADPRGRWDFTQTHFTETTEVQVRIVASGKCKPPQVSRDFDFIFQNPPKLSVDGMEITQAIQHYRAAQHLTDPADRGPDNSLRLVTGKSAWVRVYLRSGQIPGFDGGLLGDVSGTLTVERRTGGIWSQVAVLSPQNGPVDARDAFVSYDAERGNIDTTLNFVVPAAMMTGLLRFTADVASPYPQCPGNRASRSLTADVNLTQTLNAAFITIGYNGPNAANNGTLNLPAPTLAQCQAETAWALTTFPVNSQPNVRIAGTFVTNTPLNDPRSCPGCCSPNWQPLLQTVAQLVALDQAANPGGNWVYYGIINNGIPVTVPGCNWGATGGLAGRPATYAHEIGHQFGLPHARCGNAGAGNAAYPVYEPYDLPVDVPANPIGSTNWTMASIGEYGLDINDGSIANPNNAEDFMSYCAPRWISRFTHNFLVNRPELTPQVIATGSGAGAARVIKDEEPGLGPDPDAIAPRIDLFAVLDGDEVEVTAVSRVATRYLVGTAQATGYTAELLDGDTVLAADSLYAFTGEGGSRNPPGGGGGCDCGGSGGLAARRQRRLLRAMLDDVAEGDCLRVLDPEGEVVWERGRPSTRCKLQRVRVTLDEQTSDIKLSWHAVTAKGAVGRVAVRWSDDGGDTWRAHTAGLTGRDTTLEGCRLPRGRVCFQLLLDDGFSTVTAETEELELAHPRAPELTILAPTEGAHIPGERQIHLLGVVGEAHACDPQSEPLVWSIDGVEVGEGHDLWVTAPRPGKHTVELSVRGRDQTASRSFEVC